MATVVDARHEDMIHDAQLDYYSKRLATCSSDRKVKVFDVSGAEQVQIAELPGHEGPVWQVSWAHPKFGVLLASCSYDRQVLIHREAEGYWSTIYSHRAHESSVNSIAWAPYEFGLVLACASSDGSVSVIRHQEDNTWHVTKIDVCAVGCNAVSWAPYAHMGAQTDGSTTMRLVVGCCDNKVHLYRNTPSAGSSEGSWVVDKSLPLVHGDWVRDVAWVPSGGMPYNMFASCSEDGTVVVWKQTEVGGEWTSDRLSKFPAAVWRVSWSITGNILAVSCGNDSVTLWKESLGKQWELVSKVSDPAGPGATH